MQILLQGYVKENPHLQSLEPFSYVSAWLFSTSSLLMDDFWIPPQMMPELVTRDSPFPPQIIYIFT